MVHAGPLSEVVEDGRPPPANVPVYIERYDIAVPARTLTDVLADAGVSRVDFLSLDLQGFEAAAITGLDFDRWTPTIMLIEIVDEAAQRAVDAVIPEHYERVARLTVHDVLYRRR